MIKSAFLYIVIAGLFSCSQANKPTSATLDTKTVNSIRRYSYADATGKHVVIKNSAPKGGGYVDSNGKRHPYVVFYTEMANETSNAIDLKVDFPLDSFEFPLSSGNYISIFVPADTMSFDRVTAQDYGLPVKSYLENDSKKSNSLRRTIVPNGSTAFYVLMLSRKGVDGAFRTGLSLEGENLVYEVSAYKSIPGLPLIENRNFDCGSVSLKNLVLGD